MMEDNKFSYSYSAKQKAEVEEIRNKYKPKEESKIEQLRKLDKETTRKGTIVSVVVGMISTLVFGAGMSCVLVFDSSLFAFGIVLGLIGIGGMALALPLHGIITEKEKAKVADRIMALSEEILNETK